MSTYDAPPAFVAKVMNPLLEFLVGTIGFEFKGMRILGIRGRKSGQLRTVPVNLLIYQGAWYLVSPRGETQWVRNLRAAGKGELRKGRTREQFRVAEELIDEKKPAVLRSYLSRWEGQTKALFGVGADATTEQLAAIAAKHPVFRLIPVVE